MDSRGSKIRTRRKELGWTMARLSLESGVTEATISRIEAGKIPNVSANILLSVAQALGLSLDDLIEKKVNAASAVQMVGAVTT